MPVPVNPGRTYDGSRRRERARATRAAMLEAASGLFLSEGYAGTTLAMVAKEAGVSIQNVYKVFGNKPGLVKTLFDVAIAGDDEPTAVAQRSAILAVRAEPDPQRKLGLYGNHLATVAPRIMPILLVVRDAAAGDAGAADVWRDVQEERLTGMGRFASELHEAGHLRAGVSRNEARDVLWTYNSLEVWDLLVHQRRWSTRRYGSWIAAQLVAALL